MERHVGKPFRQIQLHKYARDLFGVLTFFAARSGDPAAVEQVRRLPLNEAALAVDWVDYDMPAMFENGAPDGGSIVDEFLCLFCRPPFKWLPTDVRQQKARDLLLILEAMNSVE